MSVLFRPHLSCRVCLLPNLCSPETVRKQKSWQNSFSAEHLLPTNEVAGCRFKGVLQKYFLCECDNAHAHIKNQESTIALSRHGVNNTHVCELRVKAKQWISTRRFIGHGIFGLFSPYFF